MSSDLTTFNALQKAAVMQAETCSDRVVYRHYAEEQIGNSFAHIW